MPEPECPPDGLEVRVGGEVEQERALAHPAPHDREGGAGPLARGGGGDHIRRAHTLIEDAGVADLDGASLDAHARVPGPRAESHELSRKEQRDAEK